MKILTFIFFKQNACIKYKGIKYWQVENYNKDNNNVFCLGLTRLRVNILAPFWHHRNLREAPVYQKLW